MTQFDASTVVASLALAQRLRAAGMRVDLYPETDRYGKQFKYAEERGIRYAALLSPRELEAGVVAVKDLVSGEQVEVGDGGYQGRPGTRWGVMDLRGAGRRKGRRTASFRTGARERGACTRGGARAMLAGTCPTCSCR